MLASNHLIGFGVGDAGYVPPTTAYANAGGTGNRTASITVTYDAGTALGGGTVDRHVDGAFGTTAASAFYFSTGGTGSIIKYDFGVGAQKYIDEIKLYQNNPTAQGTWAFEASNDNSNWTQIGSNFTWDAPSTGTAFTMTHASPAAYRYYRLRLVSGATDNARWQQEIEFKIG